MIDCNDKIPVLALRDTVAFPNMLAPFLIGREFSLESVVLALKKNKTVILLTQKDSEMDHPDHDDLYNIGT